MLFGKTTVMVSDSCADLGKLSAACVGKKMRELLASQNGLRIVFSAAESQESFYHALAKETDIDWSRVVCFNVDEFWDPQLPREYTCGYITESQLYSNIDCQAYHLINHSVEDPESEARRFEELVRVAPIDIACLGIGMSGHIALNEPYTTDFQDLNYVQVVRVDEQSKKQLETDPNFEKIGYIPDLGITMTIPALLSAKHIYTMVPLANKKEIIAQLLKTPRPTVALPASILSEVESTLFLDEDSCPDFLREELLAAPAKSVLSN